jgi:hypothetical protein
MSTNLLPNAPIADYFARGATQDVDGYLVFDGTTGSQTATFVFPTPLTPGNAFGIDYECPELSEGGGINFIFAGGGSVLKTAANVSPVCLRANTACTSLMVRALTGTVARIKITGVSD